MGAAQTECCPSRLPWRVFCLSKINVRTCQQYSFDLDGRSGGPSRTPVLALVQARLQAACPETTREVELIRRVYGD
jgi:hypothetical protein